MENENSTNQKSHALADTAAYLKENPTAPARILVSTVTHLVPGDGYFTKTRFIQNLICQHHWSRDFEKGNDRFEAYNDQFGVDNRNCYFLVDHGQSPNGDNDVIPILWYRWTGSSLLPIQKALPSKIQQKLDQIPFTPPKPPPKRERREVSALERCRNTHDRLRYDMGLSREDFQFLKNSPGHVKWLEQHNEPKLWSKMKSLETEWEEFHRKINNSEIRVEKI